ncbi:hypothetical protein qu_692 [Acanthamoeba polyphaga mimivirus]|nr:hypothetical protein [Mimivirus reunion]WMV62026.1 hypothetical protein qu_692 [Mimivirus sp.]WMV63003.1 hypothetical protein qu_692 [Acanthamoeba polyphaga mimivirus]WMV63980.1 hypothetical protein qu_692 [Mimivirus sp.]
MDSYEPSQLIWARLLLYEISKRNGETEYQHTNGPVWWGPNDNKTVYLSITDCSGFVNALLRKSFELSQKDMVEWFDSQRPLAVDYYNTIYQQNGFTRIKNIYKLEPGDFIAIKFPNHHPSLDDTGHIMMINSYPEIMASKNLPDEYQNYNDILQFRVNVIDQTATPHGRYDTRYSPDDNQNGLGSGYIKLYTNIDGTIIGYSWSLSKKSRYIDKTVHPIVVGRLDIY